MNIYTLRGNPVLDTTVHSRITISSPWSVSRPSHLHSSAPHDHLSSRTSHVPSTQMLPLLILSRFLQESLKTSHIQFTLLRNFVTHIRTPMYLQYKSGGNSAAFTLQWVRSVWAVNWFRPTRFYKHDRTVIIWNPRSFTTVGSICEPLWLCFLCSFLY